METGRKKLTALQLDALKEVGNIGAAHAATALAQIISKTVMILVSRIEVIPVADICRVVGGPQARAVALRMRMLGDVRGDILLALREEDAGAFAGLLLGSAGAGVAGLDEAGESMVKEAGSILAASYLRAIGDLLRASLIPSVPRLMRDEMGAIARSVFTKAAQMSDLAFCIETEFSESASRMNGHFLLIPDARSLDFILGALGVLEK